MEISAFTVLRWLWVMSSVIYEHQKHIPKFRKFPLVHSFTAPGKLNLLTFVISIEKN